MSSSCRTSPARRTEPPAAGRSAPPRTSTGSPSDLMQAYAVFPREGEPALFVSPTLAVNAADLWIRDLHIFGKPGLDATLPPATIPPEFCRLFDLLQEPNGNATPMDALL